MRSSTLVRNLIHGSLLVWIFAISAVKGEIACTNWNGIAFQLVMPGTNLFVGDPIPVSLVMSNASDRDQIVRWQSGDPCGCGFGLFEIMDLSSGNPMECKSPDHQRPIIGAGMIGLKPHQSHGYDSNLLMGYSLTNSGLYSIRGVHYFYVTEPPTPTNRQIVSVATPPVKILLSYKTNALNPKR